MNKRILLLFALIFGFNAVKAQECQNLNLYKTNSTCTFSTTTLEATFKNTEYRSSTNYQVSQEDIACPPSMIQTPPVGIVIDDGYSQIINIGFTFCYYGNMYDQIVVNDNGFVTFDLSVHDSHDFNTYTIPDNPIPYLPTPQEQTNAIYACWSDTFTPAMASPGLGIQFRIINQDEPGNRIFIVDWKDVPMYGNHSEVLSASLYLYETSNVIETNIYDVGSSSTNNGRALIGIQNKSGTLGITAPGRDTGTWPANFNGPEKYRFIPDGDLLNYSFQWYADFNHDGDFTDANECLYCGTGEAVPQVIDVNPDEETEYMAQLDYQGECSWDPVPPIVETITVEGRANLYNPNNQYSCEDVAGSGEAVFNLIEDGQEPLQNFTAQQIADLYNVIYFYETDEDGDIVMDHVVEIPSDAMTVDQDGNPISLLNYYTSPDREIQILVELNCDGDYDGDGMNNCEDPYPEIACDPTDVNDDCDGDGILNGIDTAPNVYGPCNIDTDNDGMYDCADPDPDSFCDVTDPLEDCDGDGILNGNDTSPLISDSCDATFDNGDCDNDGISNINDADTNCDINDCDLDCDGDGIPNCLDMDPSYSNCDTDFLSFSLNVLELEFEYPSPICSNDINPSPQLLDVNPFDSTDIYIINNGGVWVNPLTGTDINGDPFTYSEDGIIDIDASGQGTDNTGEFIISHTATFENLEINQNDTITITCDNASNFTIHIDAFQDASFEYPTAACKNADIADWPMASNFIGSTDFEISTGGIFTDAANGVIDIENTPAGTYTITHTLVNGACTDIVAHEITIYDTEFNYPNNEVVFCYDTTNPVSEMPVGEYTINNGGVIDAATGEIDIQGSYLGNDGSGEFEVTHTINNDCSYVLAIKIVKDTSFEFPSEVCSYDTAEAFNIAEVGGTFSIENNTATIDSSGALDLSTTTEGETYTIVYEFTVDGLTCTTTHDVYIYITPDATMPVTVLTECNNGDGTGKFDVLSLENEIVGTQSGMTLTFHLTQNDAQDGINAITTSPYARVSGNIWARVESPDGCYSVAEVPLVVEDCYAVLPQAFSPNSNIVENQTFNITNLRETYPNFSISIYNRYGNLVYEGDINTENWNGKLNNDGDLLPAGTYFYGIKLNDEQELQYRGWVYLQE